MPDDRPPRIRNEINRDNPRERGRHFLAARLMPLRPKDAETGGPAGPESARTAQEPERRLPHDFRRKLVEQYRHHQRADAARRAAAGSGEAPGEDRPEARQPGPPVPPPVSGWIPIGPSVVRQGQTPALPPVSGRVQAIAVAQGGSPVYAGAANGGVWRSDDSGRTWRSLMESFDVDPPPVAEKDPGADSLSCGAVAIHPAHPDKIYVGTGEAVVHGYFGVGPVVSTDGGQSWVREKAAEDPPALEGSLFYALAVNPRDPDRVVAATTNGIYRREPDRDGGFCWVHTSPPGQNETTSVVATRTGNTTTFYASGTDGHVFTSADGESWDEIGIACPGTDGEPAFPGEDVKRVGLAVQPANGRVVYALVARKTDEKLHGVYRLDLADGTWRKVLGVPGRPARWPGSVGRRS